MDHTVVKTFSTPRRRFHAGDAVTASDIEGPLSLSDWVDLGFVRSDAAPAEVVETASPHVEHPADADPAA